jgi:hypothetical protein
LFGWEAVAGQCAFRADALASVDYWDESFIRATDQELWARLSRRGPVVLSPKTVLTYRIHAGQWRPTEIDDLMTATRVKAVGQLQGSERDTGERILEDRALALDAFINFLDARAGAALWRYLRVCGRRPSLLGSPLTRPIILVPMSRCMVGSLGIRLGRRILARLDRMRHRKLDLSVRSTVKSDGRQDAK